MAMVRLTHKGWFGPCPIYLAWVTRDEPFIAPRHWSLLPLLAATEYAFRAWFLLREMWDEDYKATWPLLVTGAIKEPVEVLV